jgi:alanyl-tRNA synthetase
VLKGGLQKVLGAKLTVSVYARNSHGRLTIQHRKKPSAEEMKRVEDEANKKIDENAELLQFEMEREEAERHFGQQIYDLFPISKEITRLKIVRIPEWEINCCAEKHVEYTSEIGRIKIDGFRFRTSKQLLEVKFHLIS